ncbi:MAG: ATP-binding protein [Cyclobacteriaceae bacterium]
MLRDISKNQVIDRIRFENPWWVTGRIEEDYDRFKRRLYLEIFFPLVTESDIRRGIVLMGPRRVGKTVMLQHTIQKLIDIGGSPQKIIFITIENPVYNNIGLEQLFAYAREALGSDELKGWTVIFDEIQYLKNWEVHLKTLVDSYRQTKFIASGSAAAALKYKSQESGAGRFTDFLLPPLTFHEYIYLNDLAHIMKPVEYTWQNTTTDLFTTTHLDNLNEHFLNYINFGGYPEVMFSKKMQADPGRYIRQDIIDKVLLRDLPSLYGISDVQELNSLFTTIAYNSANEFSLDSLSTTSGVAKNTIKKYLEYLEAAFLIKTVRRVDQSGKRFQRDNFFKIYLTNPSLRSALFSPLSPNDESLGMMVETAIYSQWMHREWFTPRYARWNNGEVDMVALSDRTLKPAWALEIKWSDRYYDKPEKLRSLIRFCKESELDQALVTSIQKEGTKEVEGLALRFIPAAVYAYTIGYNTLKKKQYF